MTASDTPRQVDEVERELVENLRAAAYIFQTQKDGRLQGSILGCRSVVRFIRRRGGAAELAGPFLQIAAAFEDLEKGGTPALFAKKTMPKKERGRSPERKHIHLLAAAALEVLISLRDERGVAAAHVARHINRWPGMGAQNVTAKTIAGWRDKQRRLPDGERRGFNTVVGEMKSAPDPRQVVDDLLRKGPPGYWPC
jgi:hypothetical protein